MDNASSDGSAAAIRAACPTIPVLENPHNLGYAAAINQGIAHIPDTPYVLITNADVLCGPVAIAAMAQWLDAHPATALVGPCLRNHDGTLQLSWGQEPHFLTECLQRAWWRRLEACGRLERYAATPRPVDWVLGACFMIRREAFTAVGGMDPRYFMYFEEVDLCTRLRRAGWEVWYLPETIAAAVHVGRASTRQVPEAMAVAYRRSQLQYYRQYHGTWAAGLLRAYLWIRLGRTSQGRHALRAWQVMLGAAGLAAVTAGLALLPMLQEPSKILCAYDHPGDAMISIWSTWVRREAAAGRWPLSRVPLIAAPEGVNLGESPPEPAIEWPQQWLAGWCGDVRAFNLHLWATFPLAAACMALFVWELTALPAAAIVGGLLYANIPYHFAHTMQLSLASIQWLPLALWSWCWLANAPSLRRAVVHALCVSLVFWTTMYYGFLLAIASLVLVPGLAWRPGMTWRRYRAFLRWGGVALAGAVAGSLAWYWPFLRIAVRDGASAFAHRYAWPFKHLFIYSAKPWDYLVPSVHHPWWGTTVQPFVTAHLFGSNIVEQTVYLGVGALALAGWAVVRAWRHRPAERPLVGLLGALALAGLWCSAPPYVPLGPFQIVNDQIVTARALYFPSAWWYPLVPFFRVYARFGLLVAVAVAALAGLGWAWTADAARSWAGARRLVMLGLVAGWLCLDYSIAMPFHRLEPVPPVYTWLAQQPGDPIVVEYPYLPSTHAYHAEYLFYQRTHRKRLLNGAFEQTPQGQARLTLTDLAGPGTVARLQQQGADLVIVHRERYATIPPRPTTLHLFGVAYEVPPRHRDEQLSAPPTTIAGLRRVATFGDTVVYQLER